MFNVAVINLKKLLKNLLTIIIVAILVAMIFKFGNFKGYGVKAHVGFISNNIRIGAIRNSSSFNKILKSELVRSF